MVPRHQGRRKKNPRPVPSLSPADILSVSAGLILAAGRSPGDLPPLRVGAGHYAPSLTAGPMFFEGEPVEAATLGSSREIVIAGDIPEDRRFHVLLRELCRAWGFETGEPQPRDVHSWCDLCATTIIAMLQDLLAAGRPGKATPARRTPRLPKRLRVGPFEYAVKVTRGPLSHDGRPCLWACAQQSRELLISGEAEPADRMRLMLRALAHAWLFAYGEPHTRDGWLDRMATFAEAANEDMQAAGAAKGAA